MDSSSAEFSQQISTPKDEIKLPIFFKIIIGFYAIVLPLASLYALLINLYRLKLGFSTHDFNQIVTNILINLTGAFFAVLAYQRKKYALYILFLFPFIRLPINYFFIMSDRNYIDIIATGFIMDMLLFASAYKRLKEFH